MNKPDFLKQLTKEIENIKIHQFGDFIRVMSAASDNNILIKQEDEEGIDNKYSLTRNLLKNAEKESYEIDQQINSHLKVINECYSTTLENYKSTLDKREQRKELVNEIQTLQNISKQYIIDLEILQKEKEQLKLNNIKIYDSFRQKIFKEIKDRNVFTDKKRREIE